ncbi:ankyrin repeat domain-containing protein (plasmid) [Streptomyces poriferorum]|uniref:ankyrin repeat domain-containing protein n=1 Tax=Streptomyces poriferorum TaxID=2798799 RepID=UPI00273DA77F|nr:ankyrin repeat domain-containing protein [Streptomyces sp. Alt1]WLQ53697.1 ankyrin repeat domain-containing protein [Streptomyces sp. Alt1]
MEDWLQNFVDDVGNDLSPLHQAVEISDLEELTRVLDAGADPDEIHEYSGWTPLLRAIDGELDGSVQTGNSLGAAATAVLLAYGADPERPSRDGLTPMHLAFQTRHEMAVRLLEAHIARRRAAG